MPAGAGWVTFPLAVVLGQSGGMTRPAVERPDVTAAAVAAAVRHNLTSPGSVPPAEQFRLIHADRTAHDLPADTPPQTT